MYGHARACVSCVCVCACARARVCMYVCRIVYLDNILRCINTSVIIIHYDDKLSRRKTSGENESTIDMRKKQKQNKNEKRKEKEEE